MTSIYRLFRLCGMAVALSGLLGAADDGKMTTSLGYTAVEIDGARFSMADVEQKNSGAVFQARNSVFEAQRKAADDFINDYVLQREAAKEHITAEELLKKRVYSTVTEPSEEALHVYYEGVDTTEPYEAVRDKIRDAIRERRTAKAKAAFIQSLRSRASIQVWLAPPRIEMAGGAPTRGAASPSVRVVEFADYECPYCQQVEPILARVEAEYKDRVAFTFKDAPLPMHANAQKASEAAHCAGSQGKYWEYHDLLFASKQLGVADLKHHARALGLNGDAFDQCLDSGAEAAKVKASLNEAQALGVPGTPGFFVNGRFIKGAVDYHILRQVIEDELVAASTPATREMASKKP